MDINHQFNNINSQKTNVSSISGAPTTTDALIINSNSNVVSDEIILQLQEQFGDSKQIYILNTSNASNTPTATSALSSSNSSNASSTIQYLIVDKDVDINLILQDPNIFQNPPQQPNSTPTNSTNITHNSSIPSSNQNQKSIVNNKSGISSSVTTNQSQHQSQTQNQSEKNISLFCFQIFKEIAENFKILKKQSILK
jgi:hypothetical protein